VIKLIGCGCVLVLLAGAAGAQTAFLDSEAVLQFQRAADTYAFTHRQADRRGARAPAVEGALFTPQVAAAFRTRLHAAASRAGCGMPAAGGEDFTVPRVNASDAKTRPLPPCLAAVLPVLPVELEYRHAGVALLLIDAHLHLVIDVLHAAFPQPAAPSAEDN
jgi:hypothetical protein